MRKQLWFFVAMFSTSEERSPLKIVVHLIYLHTTNCLPFLTCVSGVVIDLLDDLLSFSRVVMTSLLENHHPYSLHDNM
jgi:hypothetical protein